jgi:hypothetical protein
VQRLSCRAAGIVVLACVYANSAGAREDSPAGSASKKEQFLKEYEPAARRLADCYNHLQLTEDFTRYNPGRAEQPKRRVWRADGSSYRIDVLASDGSIETARVGTPEVGFRVKRGEAAQNKEVGFVVTDVRTPDQYDASLKEARIGGAWLPFVPYCFLDDTIVDCIRDPDFTVTDVTDTGTGSARRVKLSFSLLVNKKPMAGWFEFAPEDGWVQSSCSMWDGGTTFEIEYGDRVDGVPVPKKFTFRRQGLPGDVPWQAAELVDCRKEHFDPKIFSSTDFGLPELIQRKRSRFPVMLACSLGALTIGGVLAYLARRRRGAT